jgi:VacB/RNase II family 3'-5' exoribonuclease
MLNQESLSQLKGLKDQMESVKEHADALVKGTQARYGFAVLEDGREIFIPPDEMLKAFPDDRVRVCIRPDKGDRPIAEIERLLDCPLGEFTGRCVRKGKAIFVAPDLPRLSRWLFIPPHARNGVSEGDYVRCAVLRHPIKDGKPQAKILSVVGNADTVGIENLYTAAKFQLPTSWSEAALKEMRELLTQACPSEDPARADLTDLEFVSIDAARTQDIDDALYAEITSGGWNLYVAIADPTAYIKPDSLLEREIASRATSAYFHGDALPMMPEELSQQSCALAENETRPALVCRIAVSDDGLVGDFEFIEARVRSRAKLSYYAVDRYLSGDNDELMSHSTPLEALYQVYQALRGQRARSELVMEDRLEYRWILNDKKHIDHIEQSEKLLSQRLVEECMVAANRCSGRFLRDRECSGPFIRHPGFRGDRKDEIRKFLERFLPDHVDSDVNELAVYRDIMVQLAKPGHSLPLRSMVNRMLTRAHLDTSPGVHMGMSLPCYSNCTSPLRKYVDFLTHRQIKQTLRGEAAQTLVEDSLLKTLGERIQRVRSAAQESEQWLQCVYMSSQVGTEFDATITHINSSGFSARLLINGIAGTVDLRKDEEKFTYDRWSANLRSKTRVFVLDSPVRVILQRVDSAKREIVFSPVATDPIADKPAAPAPPE